MCDVYGFRVNVTDTSSFSGSPFHYLWYYGDNGSSWVSTDSNSTTHTYYSAGRYVVSVIVNDTPNATQLPSRGNQESFVVTVPSSSSCGTQ